MKKKIYIFTLLCIILFANACSKNNKVKEESIEKTDMTTENKISTETENIKVDQTKTNTQTTEEKETKIDNQISQPKDEYTTNDKIIINAFNKTSKEVDETLKEETSESAKDKLKGTFIMMVDFIFYDSEIDGIKFKDLTDGAKENILDTVNMIDSKIMTKYPNYKEEISTKTSSAYNKASELIKKGANNISNFSKDKLGEDNYNAIIEAKDELIYYSKEGASLVGNVTGSIFNKTKSKIKKWYENLKS